MREIAKKLKITLELFSRSVQAGLMKAASDVLHPKRD
jgi:hypothetical protein